MKKTFRSILSIAIVICMFSTSLFTGTFALSDGADNLRKQIVSAINGLEVTADTTAEDIIAAVTAVDANATTTWKVDFTKVLPTNGAIITLNGVEVDGGVVRAHDGSIKGILNVESAGSNFDVAVDFTLKATYETIDCTKQATINVIPSADETAGTATFATNAGYVADADLVIIERTSGSWNISNNFFKDNTTIKAVIAKTSIANCMSNSFSGTSSLQAVVFNGRVSSIQTKAFWASKVKYIEFSEPVEATTKLNIDTNAFGYSGVNNLYISSFPMLKINTNAFVGAKSLQQLRVDGASINTVASGSLLTHETRSIATVVCNDAATASKFTGSGALATIDVSKTAIVDYYGEVSKIKVMDDVTVDYVVSAAEALDTADAFTVSAEKNGNVFEVSITDANAVTAIAYVETFSSADLKASVETILDKYSYTNTTTQEDINNYLQGILGNEYEIVWLENYSMTEKVDGAEVWARIDADSDYALYGTVPGQDKVAHGSFVIKNYNTCAVIELNKVLEKANYKKYELTGIQTTNGAGIANSDTTTCHYDGVSELVIVNGSTIYTSHMNGAKIDGVLGAGTSDKIKAVIVKGNPKENWSCFASLKGLEVAIIENTAVTKIGNSVFGSCTNLKYVYIPDNLLTTTVGTANNAHAFYKCSPFTVLVPQGFDTTSLRLNKVNNVYTYANGVIRYSKVSDSRNLINFYNDVLNLTAPSASDLEKKIKTLSSYDESYTVVIETTDSEFIVTINDLLVVTISMNQAIKESVSDVLTNYSASNDTTADDITNDILGIPGVETVIWSNDYGFEKILATNGARIRLNGKVVEDGIVRGHYGSITGVITVTTAMGEVFDVKVAITIDPVYENIDCTKSTTVTIESDTDKYSTANGYDAEADLVIINVKNASLNVPANYIGATSDLKNDKIKAIIFKDDVSTVLEKAFWHTSALQAVVFKKVASFNNQAFWASAIKYIEFGSTGKNFNIGNANIFGYCRNLTGLYIEDRDSVSLGNQAFVACQKLTQIYVDADTITKIGTSVFNSNSSATASVTTVVCNGAENVSMVEAAGALAVIDATTREISDYDVNVDFKFDARDIVRIKKMVAALSDDIIYDVNNDGAVNATDLIVTRQELLGDSNNAEISVLNNTYRRLVQDNELNVAYFGGSVTNGFGATDSKYSWASRVTQYLKNKFPQAEIDSLNAAIGGTGTEFGIYRAVQDLKLETRTPDLVFVEFAVNDVYDGVNGADSQRYMENIIRTIYSYAPKADIVMVFITNSGLKGAEFEQLIAQRELAEAYGIPCINVGKALCDEMSTYLDMSLIDANSPEWLKFFTDTVHPTDAGYERYASYITDYLDKVFYPHRKEKVSQVSYMPKAPINTMLVNPEIFNASDVESIDNFTITSAGNLNTTTNGATLTVKFTGTSLKLWCYAYPESSSMECSVDGGTPTTTEIYRGSANHKIFKVADGLSDTEHTVKITFKNIKSKVDIRYFLITGESENKNFSLTK